MTLKPSDVESFCQTRYGAPAKEATDKIIGFATVTGKVFGFPRETTDTMIWFQPPAPPPIPGVTLLDKPNNGNSNINGPLLPLTRPDTQRVLVEDRSALERFLDWYDGFAAPKSATATGPTNFSASFAQFQELVTLKSGEPFSAFDEGLIAAWESYKPRVRAYALELLGAETWTEDQIGSGDILEHVIAAIEIQATHGDRTNNMVFWQNRYGHAQRDHRALLEARNVPAARREFEQLIFDLYRTDRKEGAIFDRLKILSDSKYPLLAYLFFLKDMDRFMPIQPTGFDRVFNEMGIEFSTLRNCSWDNYKTFNAILDDLRSQIADIAGLSNVRLIDAHSFCWLFTTLLKEEVNGELTGQNRASEKLLGAREKSIADIKYSVGKTVFNSNGQVVPTKVKDKQLHMTDDQLDKKIRELLDIQGDRCAITGIPFQFQGAHEDSNLLPSLDRIDSDGHYEADNLQLVCRFINFWKQAADDKEFRRLIMLVRGQDT